MNGGFGGNAQPQRIAQRPKALICYICGRQYGTNSLKIHLKSCIKIWEEREALKPKRERKPVPKAPAAFEQAIGGKGGAVKVGCLQSKCNNKTKLPLMRLTPIHWTHAHTAVELSWPSAWKSIC